MRVVVAGATGAIGRPVVRTLVARGHEVVGLSRSDANDAVLARLGAKAERASMFDADALVRPFGGADAVLRIATHIPASPRDADGWAQNDRIRRDGTRALLAACERAGVPYFAQESIVWVARPDDGRPFAEDATPNPDAVTASALDAERAAREAPLATATLRLGFVYGPESGQVREMAAGLRKRRVPVVGDGAARLSFVHHDDVATAFALAVEKRPRGLFHVVDGRPTSTREFFDAFADAVGAPRPPRVPRWVARLAVGATVTRLLTVPMVTRPDRFRAATGWSPSYPSAVDGVRKVAAAL